jgi:hypothetical protein
MLLTIIPGAVDLSWKPEATRSTPCSIHRPEPRPSRLEAEGLILTHDFWDLTYFPLSVLAEQCRHWPDHWSGHGKRNYTLPRCYTRPPIALGASASCQASVGPSVLCWVPARAVERPPSWVQPPHIRLHLTCMTEENGRRWASRDGLSLSFSLPRGWKRLFPFPFLPIRSFGFASSFGFLVRLSRSAFSFTRFFLLPTVTRFFLPPRVVARCARRRSAGRGPWLINFAIGREEEGVPEEEEEEDR